MRGIVPVRFHIGDVIRIDSRQFIVGAERNDYRIFVEKETGKETLLASHGLMNMVRTGRLTTDAAFRAIDTNVMENLQVDWGAFSELERNSALQKYPYVKGLQQLPEPWRTKRDHINDVIKAVEEDKDRDYPYDGTPRARLVSDWFKRWVAAGRDIRALIDNHSRKGNRTDRVDQRVRHAVNLAIDDKYAPQDGRPPGTMAAALEEARFIIELHNEAVHSRLPTLGAKKLIGKHLVARSIAKRDQYELAARRHGPREAAKLARANRVGPIVTRPLEEAEVDHTQLDLIVCDNEGRTLGRPYITAIIDRFSRMILGFSLSFTPPSWVSVMEALRIALQPKERFLESVCRAIGKEMNFEFPYPCFGSIDRLFCDNGPEFRSYSMKETQRALNMQIIDLPRGQPWLKGRIERYFGTQNTKLVHRLPGTTKSNPNALRNYKPMKNVQLTLEDANWLVAKFIVDHHHTNEHSETGQKPLDMWERGIREYGQPAPPSDQLLVPLTGKVIQRKLSRDGIQYKNLKWQSDNWSPLLARAKGFEEQRSIQVTVRIDPMDLNVIYVLDETKIGERDAWIEGRLETDDPNIAGMTLYQYEHYLECVRKEEPAYDRETHLKQARSAREMSDYVRGKLPPSKAVRAKIARLMTGGRNAGQHVRGSRFSPEDSREPVGYHDHHDPQLLSPPPDERGPYRGRSPVPAGPRHPEQNLDRLDPAAFNETARTVMPTRPSATLTEKKQSRSKLVVRPRRHMD